jgi:hypothetical protein
VVQLGNDADPLHRRWVLTAGCPPYKKKARPVRDALW